jgi:uncharacterized protein YkwD
MSKKKVLLLMVLFLSAFSLSYSDENILTLEEVRGDFLLYVNAYRQQKKLPPLTLKYCGVTQAFANRQAEEDRYLSHEGFNERASTIKKAFEQEISQNGHSLKSFSIRENCCWFSVCPDPAKKAFELFKRSSGHRSNMLQNNEYTSIGIAQSGTGAFYFCQIFF